MKPYRSSSFFKTGNITATVEGTVARGFLKLDTNSHCKKAGKATPNFSDADRNSGWNRSRRDKLCCRRSVLMRAQGAAAYPDDVEVFPIPVTAEVVKRGKERYEIFCSACHGLTGNGDGMIVRRGFRRAASFNDDRLRQAPVGHFFDAITNGWGAMPSYASQICHDRGGLIAYIRALQLSQQKQSRRPAPGTPNSIARKSREGNTRDKPVLRCHLDVKRFKGRVDSGSCSCLRGGGIVLIARSFSIPTCRFVWPEIHWLTGVLMLQHLTGGAGFRDPARAGSATRTLPLVLVLFVQS